MIVINRWFNCKEKPTCEGWYECRMPNIRLEPYKLYWDGVNWLNSKGINWISCFGSCDKDEWHGLVIKL